MNNNMDNKDIIVGILIVTIILLIIMLYFKVR